MPDPFHILATPVEPVDPDPVFASRLRARLAEALSLPKGAPMTTPTNSATTDPAATDPAVTETFRHGDVGYASLWVPDETRARRFFADVLGWPEEGHREAGPGRVGHGFSGGVDHATLFLAIGVDDLTEARRRVTAHGGRSDDPVDEPWGATSMCTDPAGLRLALYQLPAEGRDVRPAPNGVGEGDLAYITIEVPDSAAEREFYGAVAGWTFEPGQVADGWQMRSANPMGGIAGGAATATIVPMYRVDDIEAALGRVRAAGGDAPEPDHMPYGLSSLCRDDQGTRFYLWQEQ